MRKCLLRRLQTRDAESEDARHEIQNDGTDGYVLLKHTLGAGEITTESGASERTRAGINTRAGGQARSGPLAQNGKYAAATPRHIFVSDIKLGVNR